MCISIAIKSRQIRVYNTPNGIYIYCNAIATAQEIGLNNPASVPQNIHQFRAIYSLSFPTHIYMYTGAKAPKRCSDASGHQIAMQPTKLTATYSFPLSPSTFSGSKSVPTAFSTGSSN